MNKILIVDDDISRWKNKIPYNFDGVVLTDNPKEFFDWDSEGTVCNLKFPAQRFDYVFFHHSQAGDSMLPSNLIDLLSVKLRGKMVLFSGGIRDNFQLDEGDVFSRYAIRRDRMSKKILEFIKTSQSLNRWELDALFYNIDKILIAKISVLTDINSSVEVFDSHEMRDFLALYAIGPDDSIYHTLKELSGADLIDKLRIISG